MAEQHSGPGNGAVQCAAALRPLAQLITGIERPHPVRVGVDGFSAAGKSTLADELAAMVTGQGRPCLRADLDDFKRPRTERPAGPEGYYRGAFDLDAIRTFLLAPLGPGGDRQIRLRFFDQQHQAYFPAEVQSVPADAVVIADGAYLLRPELRDLWDFRIFVEIDFDLVLARGTARDAAWMDSAQAAIPGWSGQSRDVGRAIWWHLGKAQMAKEKFARVKAPLTGKSPFHVAELEAVVLCGLGQPDDAERHLLEALPLRAAGDRTEPRSLYDLLSDPPLPGIDRLRAIAGNDD